MVDARPWFALAAARRPQRPADHDRHAARRRAVVLRRPRQPRRTSIALAARGARFTFAHAQAVVTLPSHASILTGRYPYEHGVRDNNGYRLAPATPTLATRLKALGFATGAFVGGFPVDQRFGLSAGFDVYDDRVGEIGSQVDFALPERRADVVVGRRARLDRQQTVKWFALGARLRSARAVPAAGRVAGALSRPSPTPAKSRGPTHALGPLFDRLATLPRPTLVIVTADHGESLGEHGELTHGIFAYESTLHVPLIVAELEPPGAATRGVVIDTPARHIDLAAHGPRRGRRARRTPTLAGASLLRLIATGRGADRPVVLRGDDRRTRRAAGRRCAASSSAATSSSTCRSGALRSRRRSARTAQPARRPQAPRRQVLPKRSRLQRRRRRPAGRGNRRRRANGCARSATSAAARPRRATATPKPTTRSGSSISTSCCTGRAISIEHGQLDEAASDLHRRDHAAAGYGRRLPLPRVHLLAGGPARPAIATLEDGAQERRHASRMRVKLGFYLAETGRRTRRSRFSRACRSDDIEALNALGIAYGHARPSR